jgi:hypothetical protein
MNMERPHFSQKTREMGHPPDEFGEKNILFTKREMWATRLNRRPERSCHEIDSERRI